MNELTDDLLELSRVERTQLRCQSVDLRTGTAGRRSPRVELGSLVQDGHTTFFVRDNGAGFDHTRANLFTPFQRLPMSARAWPSEWVTSSPALSRKPAQSLGWLSSVCFAASLLS